MQLFLRRRMFDLAGPAIGECWEVSDFASLLDAEKSDAPFLPGIFADFECNSRMEDDQNDRTAQDNEGAQQQQG